MKQISKRSQTNLNTIGFGDNKEMLSTISILKLIELKDSDEKQK